MRGLRKARKPREGREGERRSLEQSQGRAERSGGHDDDGGCGVSLLGYGSDCLTS